MIIILCFESVRYLVSISFLNLAPSLKKEFFFNFKIQFFYIKVLRCRQPIAVWMYTRKWKEQYTCQLSRLRVENFNLMPAHACGPISYAWLKNVSCCHLAWHNFQECVNSDPCKERKPCVKWINDNTFLAISDFVDKRFLDNFAFGRLRTSSEDFRLLRESSEMIVSSAKIPALPG